MKKYEYKFIRLKFRWRLFIDHAEPKNYKEIIEQHGVEGWRLNQILSPSGYSGSHYFELIFEREIS